MQDKLQSLQATFRQETAAFKDTQQGQDPRGKHNTSVGLLVQWLSSLPVCRAEQEPWVKTNVHAAAA